MTYPEALWEVGRRCQLDRAGYRADWEARKKWYAHHEILRCIDGGGPEGTRVWSEEGVSGPGINSHAIRGLAAAVFGTQVQVSQLLPVSSMFAPLSGRPSPRSATASAARSPRTDSPHGPPWRKRAPSACWGEPTTEGVC